METERLDQADPWLREFEAVVLEVRTSTAPSRNRERANAIVLNRSAFYPESGGQMADRGRLQNAEVTDVQIESSSVLHFIEGTAPSVGDRVTGTVDGSRRRAHMALHTGQHILSRALLDVGGFETVSSRLGETQCTLDLNVEVIDEEALSRAEDLANAIVDDDLVVGATYPDPETLAALSLRKAPPKVSRARIVEIGDFDATPCGGTHCTRTGQVGLVAITGIERHKRRMRLHFTAGPRARNELSANDHALRDIAKRLSCSPLRAQEAIDKLSDDVQTLRKESKLLVQVAARSMANALGDRTPPIVATIDGPPAVARSVAQALALRPEMVCLLAADEASVTHIVAARGSDARFDCGDFVRRATEVHGGRGGGRPDRAEGKLPVGLDWQTVARAILAETKV